MAWFRKKTQTPESTVETATAAPYVGKHIREGVEVDAPGTVEPYVLEPVVPAPVPQPLPAPPLVPIAQKQEPVKLVEFDSTPIMLPTDSDDPPKAPHRPIPLPIAEPDEPETELVEPDVTAAEHAEPIVAPTIVDEEEPEIETPFGSDESGEVERYVEPVVELPDITPPKATPKPAPAKPKEPMFSWRGKPIGGGAVETPAPQPTAAPRGEVSVDDSGVDPQVWFADAMSHALDVGASDLHLVLDVKENRLVARIRLDGQMRDLNVIDGVAARIIMGKFKTAASLSSGGNFVPEESLYEIEVDGEKRKARIALFRTNTGGDALVLRLPPTGELRRLDELEFADTNLELFYRMLKAANRMVLIAGPMGSGKTTTAHAALTHVATPNRAVWSVEDPVERDIDEIVQLEVDDANGAGFETLLPSLVRSDYDTLFIGEVRDRATAGAAVRQAKAGRQVLTTIHANNNVTALLRLIDLAEDTPLSVLDSVLGVVSQRLVRRLNPDWDGESEDRYRGRVPIHEVLLINDDLVDALMKDAPIAEINALAVEASESTFERDADRLVAAGITDRAEIERVLGV